MINEEQKKALDYRLQRFSMTGVEQLISKWVGYATSGTDTLRFLIPKPEPWKNGSHVKVATVDAIAYAAAVLEELEEDQKNVESTPPYDVG
jgi:hypothetical protein